MERKRMGRMTDVILMQGQQNYCWLRKHLLPVFRLGSLEVKEGRSNKTLKHLNHRGFKNTLHPDVQRY